MLVSNGSSWSTHSFTNNVGIGSSSQDIFGHEAITLRISSDVADIRLLSLTDAKGSISTSLFASILKLVFNVLILSSRNLPNRLANSKLVSWVGRVAACWLLLSTHSHDPCQWGESDVPSCGPPASFSVHLASRAVTPAGSVHKSRGEMWCVCGCS